MDIRIIKQKATPVTCAISEFVGYSFLNKNNGDKEGGEKINKCGHIADEGQTV